MVVIDALEDEMLTKEMGGALEEALKLSACALVQLQVVMLGLAVWEGPRSLACAASCQLCPAWMRPACSM